VRFPVTTAALPLMSVAAVSRSGHSGDGVTKATGDLRDRARQNGAVAAQTKDNLQDDELSKMKQLLMGKLKSDVDVAVSLEDIVPGKQVGGFTIQGLMSLCLVL